MHYDKVTLNFLKNRSKNDRDVVNQASPDEMTVLHQRIAELERIEAQRKQSEDELFQSRELLRSILDTIPTRVFWKDRKSVYIGCNQAIARDRDFADPGQIAGTTDYDSVTPETAERYRADDREVMETGRPKLNYEEPQVKRDGTQRWLRTSKVPLHDKDGQVIGVLGTYEDITERKRAEEALRKSAEEIQDLYHQAPCGYHSLDKNGVFVRINETELAWLGYTRDEIIGRQFSEIIPPEGLPAFAATFQVLQQRGWVKDLELELVRKDGSILPVLLSASAIRDAEGNFLMSRSTVFEHHNAKAAGSPRRKAEFLEATISRHRQHQ